ncbi:MAG TPA: DUF3047 domain-containing protein [Rhodothermales bacterium]|nr:DUF3047 domain-containing protein [Rhodothermales bacterium]
MYRIIQGLFLIGMLVLFQSSDRLVKEAMAQRIVVEDFEGYPAGVTPYEWKQPHKKSRSMRSFPREVDRDNDYFEVISEGGNKRVRFYTSNESTQIVKLNGEGYTWNLRTHPRLAWDWKATRLPEGAREDEKDLNDSGAAFYVTFNTDWLGRPRSIKYTYSSTLPEGTVAEYGPLHVVVVSSARNGTGDWVHVERDVVADYYRFFRGDPPDEPISVTLWSDSDNTKKISEVYFDNITLLPAR